MRDGDTIWDYLYLPLLLCLVLLIMPFLAPAMTWVYGAQIEVWVALVVIFGWLIGGFIAAIWLDHKRIDRRWREHLKDLGLE